MVLGDWWSGWLVGALLGAVLMWRFTASRARRAAEAAARQAAPQAEALETALRENASLQADLDRVQAEWNKEREQWQSAATAWEGQQQDSVLKAEQARRSQVVPALEHIHTQGRSLQELQGIGKTFERWHADMSALVQHNRTMHDKNDEFARIVRQMVIVALNASIEAARAGAQGRGFNVVAGEMRELSSRAEALSRDYRASLYANDLIATTTFQDMQAGGKMVINAAMGLQMTNGRIQAALEEAA